MKLADDLSQMPIVDFKTCNNKTVDLLFTSRARVNMTQILIETLLSPIRSKPANF